MKSRKQGRPRPYLSQIAEPLLPGEPKLAVRRGLHTRGGPGPLDVPVVQEGNEIAERHQSPAQSARVQRPEASALASENEQPVISVAAQSRSADAAIDRPQSQREAHESKTMVRKSPATQAVAQGEGSRSQEASPARSAKSDAPKPTLSQSAQNARLAAREDVASSLPQTTAERTSSLTVAGEVRDPVVVKEVKTEQARTAHAREAQADSEVVRSLVREEKVAVLNARPLEDGFRQRPQETGADRGNPAEAISGSRVHIGTVEVRITSAQPAPTQAAAVAPQPTMERGAPIGARAGAAEPLARGLAWSYGLVQG